MKKTIHFLLCLWCLCAAYTLSAQHISGTILDQTSHFPIAKATVQLAPGYSGITNNEGQFSLSTAKFPNHDSITVSGLGYRSKTLALTDIASDTIFLSPLLEQELGQVVISNENLSPDEIMTRVKAQLSKNYTFSQLSFSVFQRASNTFIPQQVRFKFKKASFLPKSVRKDFNQKMEDFSKRIKGKKAKFYEANLAEVSIGEPDSLRVRYIKATKLINEENKNSTSKLIGQVIQKLSQSLKTSNTFKVRTGIIPVGDSVDMTEGFDLYEEEEKIDSVFSQDKAYALTQKLNALTFSNAEGSGITISMGQAAAYANFVNTFITDLDEYQYSLDKMSIFNQEPVYVISFTPDDGFLSSGGNFSGKLYVSTADFAILRADYHLGEGKHGSKLNLKFLLGFKYVEKAKSGSVIFTKTDNGTYFPSYVSLSGTKYAYFSRSFVFKENAPRKERMKFKLDFTIEFESQYKTEWVFNAIKPQSIAAHLIFDTNKGIPVQEISTYRPEIWKDYNILMPTEAIRHYE